MNLLLFERKGVDFFVTGEWKHRPRKPQDSKQGRIEKIRNQIRSAYDKLRHKFDYQENVCSALRHAKELRLIYPTSLERREAETRLNSFLTFRESKHKRWMIIDGVLALFGSILTPIPGPNVFFLYPAVRALSHYLAFRGVRHTQKLKLMTFGAESVIDRIQLNLESLDDVEKEIRELEDRFDLRNLKSHLSL
jgi:hypothetical protein